jgi:hypothetical protein
MIAKDHFWKCGDLKYHLNKILENLTNHVNPSLLTANSCLIPGGNNAGGGLFFEVEPYRGFAQFLGGLRV